MIWRGALLVVIMMMASGSARADNQQGQSCSPSGRVSDATKNGAMDDGNSLVCISGAWQYPAYVPQSAAASAGASCSTFPAGAMRYNTTLSKVEFCNGSNWSAFIGTQSTTPPTAPSGSGYFVMSKSTYSSCNFGGLSGASAKCLTELTTNTSWAGYSTANGAGLLTSAHVRAFLCDSSTCNSLTPLGTYYFANANGSSYGGANFTINSNGQGPGDSALWTAANYFGGTYTFWSNIGTTSSALWAITPAGTDGGASTCSNWSATNGSGAVGNTSSTTASRWNTGAYYQTGAYNLICVVNP